RTPGRRNVMFKALMNVRPSHLVDPALFDFAGLRPRAARLDTPDAPDRDNSNEIPLLR
ncbi:MAG TPA: tRNA 2-thiocytidine(32) synthetase TtcA, partial [Pararhodobacter sp.]|nr:tRNA 2-thiocytidine(32) synthetase TtcA [Pararhodobacter sp.]